MGKLKYKKLGKRKSLNIRADLHKLLAGVALKYDCNMEDIANEAIAQFLISEDVTLVQ